MKMVTPSLLLDCSHDASISDSASAEIDEGGSSLRPDECNDMGLTMYDGLNIDEIPTTRVM